MIICLSPSIRKGKIKLGKKPELQKESAGADSSENKRGEPSDKDSKHTASSNVEVSGTDLKASTTFVQARPTDGNADRLKRNQNRGRDTRKLLRK